MRSKMEILEGYLVDPIRGFIEANALYDLSQDANSLQVKNRKSGSLHDLGTFEFESLRKQQSLSYDREKYSSLRRKNVYSTALVKSLR